MTQTLDGAASTKERDVHLLSYEALRGRSATEAERLLEPFLSELR